MTDLERKVEFQDGLARTALALSRLPDLEEPDKDTDPVDAVCIRLVWMAGEIKRLRDALYILNRDREEARTP